MSTEKHAAAPKLYPKCPASSAGARCRNQKRHPALGLCCQPPTMTTVLPLGGVQRCPYPNLADIQLTELVCPKHGRGVEALTIAGTSLSGQFCLACSLEMLGGLLPQVAEVPVPPKAPELSVLEEATEDGFLGEVTDDQVAEAAADVDQHEAAASQPALTEDEKPEPAPSE